MAKTNQTIQDQIRKGNDIPKIVALSFFSGAMGLDIGMENGGIEAILACENNKECRKTIISNKPNIGLIGDINEYNAEQILEMANLPKNTKIDVVFGGPPCQAFSTAGNRKAFNDERGNVFLRYLSLVGDLKPTYLVIENVRGLLSAEYPFKGDKPIKGGALCVILEKIKEMGYTVSFNLYNAANFGAPQIRERVVMICKLGAEKVSYLQPTNSETGEDGLPKWNTLGDALKILPEGTIHHHTNFPENRLKYFRMLKEGEYWKNLPLEMQKEALGRSFELGGGKTGFLRRVSYSKPSPTLVTSPTMPATDLAHPIEDRPLSIEEYKCIQGFPLEWEICGKIVDQYKQIGNAVPIKLGEAIAKTIINDMNGIKYKYNGFRYSRYKNTDDASWEEQMKKVLISQGLED